MKDPNAGGKMTERDALRWLTHLIGDLHQPLHVACGFYRDGKPPLVTDPSEARSAMHDRGGNQLFYEGNKNLHGYWDYTLIDLSMKKAGFGDITAYSRHLLKTAPSEKLTGPIAELTTRWALEQVQASRKAYSGLTYGGPHFNDKQERNGQVIVLPPKYAENSSAIAVRQLSRAGTRLALLLDRIYGH